MADRNNAQPWVSFCMSTYRRTDFLRTALEGIKAQTFTDFEVVVSDNDPEQSAAAVVSALGDPRFKYFPNVTNLGMVTSFNKSIERATGEFIVMITDDDPVYPEMLQVLHDLTISHPGYGLYIGGHDTFFAGLAQARMAKARIGVNSSLADWELNAVHIYSADEFPMAFLDGRFSGGLLWSTGIVHREIALAIDGFPDYGTPHLADNAFVLLSGAQKGCVHINISLGQRVIHQENYSYSEKNYESIYKGPAGFLDWTQKRLSAASLTFKMQQALTYFVGRDMTVYVISIRKAVGKNNALFEQFRRRFFQLEPLRSWRRKYFIAVHYPNLFELFLALRRVFFSKKNPSRK
jgi:glycosyltransferase involved in cell wall biosynthesis